MSFVLKFVFQWVARFAQRIAGFKKAALRENTMAGVDQASLPADDVFLSGLEAFFRSVARPETRTNATYRQNLKRAIRQRPGSAGDRSTHKRL
jgi:hypothetical protein